MMMRNKAHLVLVVDSAAGLHCASTSLCTSFANNSGNVAFTAVTNACIICDIGCVSRSEQNHSIRKELIIRDRMIACDDIVWSKCSQLCTS